MSTGAKMPRSLGNRRLLCGSELDHRQQQCLLALLGSLLRGQRGEEARPACAKADPNPAFRQRELSADVEVITSYIARDSAVYAQAVVEKILVTARHAREFP
jgi:hypothetical protein